MGICGSKQIKNQKNVKMNQATRAMYYRAEFQSMGDVLGDGRLNKQEFTRLMTLLGLPDAAKSSEVLWNKVQKEEGGRMRVEEYVDLMMDPAVDAKTNMWRKLFAQFDTDGSGYASRQEVIEGLENMGITVDGEMKAKIKAMDSDKDDRIYYGDFLKMQLLKK